MPRHQRTSGAADIAFKRRGDRTVIDRWYQQGSVKARLPRGTPTEAVLINMAGGLTGGDRLTWQVEWQAGTTALVTAQAAEKIYRAANRNPVEISTRLVVAEGAMAEWLPQETIIFDGARLARRTDVDIDPGGRFFGVETLVFGRTAMGETVRSGCVRDLWSIRRGGRLLLHDPLRLDGDIATLQARPAVADGAKAVATVFYVGDDAAERLERLRTVLADARGHVGASRIGDLMVARFLAADGAVIRHDLALCFSCCRLAGRGLPKLWRI